MFSRSISGVVTPLKFPFRVVEGVGSCVAGGSCVVGGAFLV